MCIRDRYIHSNPALYSLRAYAEKYHPEAAAQVELAEYTINQTVEEILADLYERKPEAVAFSCYIWNWKMMQEVISELHQVRPCLLYTSTPDRRGKGAQGRKEFLDCGTPGIGKQNYNSVSDGCALQ